MLRPRTLQCVGCGIKIVGFKNSKKYCSSCKVKRTREIRNKSKKKWRKEHPEDFKKKTRDYYWFGKGQENHLRRTYGMTVQEYNELFINQNGCCKICGIHQTKLNRKLNVDHNHKTGEIRSLLCDQCNRLLGFVEKDPQRILIMLDYLKEYKCQL